MRKMLAALRNNGSPDPLFETDEGRLYFLVTIYAHEDSLSHLKAASKEDSKMSLVNKEKNSSEKVSKTEETSQTGDYRNEYVFGGVSQRRTELLDFFARSPLATISQASVFLGVGKSTVNRDIEALKAEGRLRRIGSAKKGTWHVR